MMTLFEFIRILLTDTKSYARIDDAIKRRYAFMLNRLLSIEYPSYADSMNVIGVDPVQICDAWHLILRGRYKEIPTFMRIKTKGIRMAVSKIKLSDETIERYREYYSMDRKDFDMYYDLYELDTELKQLEKTINYGRDS